MVLVSRPDVVKPETGEEQTDVGESGTAWGNPGRGNPGQPELRNFVCFSGGRLEKSEKSRSSGCPGFPPVFPGFPQFRLSRFSLQFRLSRFSLPVFPSRFVPVFRGFPVFQRTSPGSWRGLSKEEVGGHVEQLGELLRLRLADRSLSADNLGGYAAGTKHVEQVALA